MTANGLRFATDTFLWGLQGMCHLQRIPFAAPLVLQQIPPPYDFAAMQLAAQSLGIKVGLRREGIAELRALPLPCIAVLKPSHSTPKPEPASPSTDAASPSTDTASPKKYPNSLSKDPNSPRTDPTAIGPVSPSPSMGEGRGEGEEAPPQHHHLAHTAQCLSVIAPYGGYGFASSSCSRPELIHHSW